MYDNTGTICITSCEYIWHHSHSLWYHTRLWHSHNLYSCDHTQDTCHCIHCSWAITHGLLIIAHLQYVWYHTTICMTSCEFYVTSQPFFLTSKDGIHDITSTLFLNTDPLYTTWHTLHLWHHCHCNYDKTPTMFLTLYVYMISHMMNEWQHSDCIWHETQCICVIKPNWLMTSHPMYMKTHPLHVWHHRHFIWHYIHSCWPHTVVCMSCRIQWVCIQE